MYKAYYRLFTVYLYLRATIVRLSLVYYRQLDLTWLDLGVTVNTNVWHIPVVVAAQDDGYDVLADIMDITFHCSYHQHANVCTVLSTKYHSTSPIKKTSQLYVWLTKNNQLHRGQSAAHSGSVTGCYSQALCFNAYGQGAKCYTN